MGKMYVSLFFINIGKITPGTVTIKYFVSFGIIIMNKKLFKANILISQCPSPAKEDYHSGSLHFN